MKTIILFLGLMLVFASTLFCGNYFVHEKSGTKIYFATDDDMFPASWQEDDINGYAKSLQMSELGRSVEVLFRALDKYPVAVLQKNLRCIYIFKDLEFYGQPYGGTNSNDVVYVTNNGIDDGYTDAYLEQLFHAEFSSILLRNFAPESYEKTWSNINDEEFTYGEGGVKEIREGNAGLTYGEYYYESGFLYEYAMSGSENDLNSIAKNLFCPVNDFWYLYEDYCKLKSKINLAIELYHSIDSEFSISYFRNFNLPVNPTE
jgi:hypothetical protein